jgi:hypothetical protein
MKVRHRYAVIVLAAVIALNAGGRAWGEMEPRVGRPEISSRLSMARFYSGSLDSVGQFPGKLIRTQDGYALVIIGESEHHLLFSGSEDLRQSLDSCESRGQDVKVLGKYYPSSGAILVSGITTADGSASC